MNKSQHDREDFGDLRHSKLSTSAQAIVSKTLVLQRKLRLHSLYFSQNMIMLSNTINSGTVSSNLQKNLKDLSQTCASLFVCPSLGAPRTHQMAISEATGYQCYARGLVASTRKMMRNWAPFGMYS